MKSLSKFLKLRLASPQERYEDCHDCHVKVWSIFCTHCNKRFCSEHIDDLKVHTCGLDGITKKKLRQLRKLRAMPLSPIEIEAHESGRKAAQEKSKPKQKKEAPIE